LCFFQEKYNQHRKQCPECVGDNSESSDAAAIAAQQASQTELMEQEAESLKVVLDLRNDEINKLKTQNMELERQV